MNAPLGLRGRLTFQTSWIASAMAHRCGKIVHHAFLFRVSDCLTVCFMTFRSGCVIIFLLVAGVIN